MDILGEINLPDMEVPILAPMKYEMLNISCQSISDINKVNSKIPIYYLIHKVDWYYNNVWGKYLVT